MAVELATVAPQELAGHLADLQTTYERIYAAPRGAAVKVPAALAEHADRPGFKLVTVRDRRTASTLGFAYGFTGEPGQTWRDAMAEAAGESVAAGWFDGHFEFAEFGVVPELRRSGVGTALYDHLFADLPHTHAVLTVRDSNVAGRTFYHRLRWQVLHEPFVSPSGNGPYVIMGKQLP